MTASLARVREIHIAGHGYATLLDHARRKLRGDYRPGETPEPKAFGLLGGRIEGERADITDVVPLARNLRHEAPYQQHIDALVGALAVASETPLHRRGWLADPKELLAAQSAFDNAGTVLVGSYHMHRVGWPADPRRETCTALDEALARHCGLWMFVLSMVDPDRPVLRAFFEGDNEHEADVVLDGDDASPGALRVPGGAGMGR